MFFIFLQSSFVHVPTVIVFSIPSRVSSLTFESFYEIVCVTVKAIAKFRHSVDIGTFESWALIGFREISTSSHTLRNVLLLHVMYSHQRCVHKQKQSAIYIRTGWVYVRVIYHAPCPFRLGRHVYVVYILQKFVVFFFIRFYFSLLNVYFSAMNFSVALIVHRISCAHVLHKLLDIFMHYQMYLYLPKYILIWFFLFLFTSPRLSLLLSSSSMICDTQSSVNNFFSSFPKHETCIIWNAVFTQLLSLTEPKIGNKCFITEPTFQQQHSQN